MWHEVLLGQSDIVSLYHEALMPTTFSPFWLFLTEELALSQLFMMPALVLIPSKKCKDSEMTIVSGYSGGILFRANKGSSTFYYFRIGQDGSYDVRNYINPLIGNSSLLISGFSPSITTGYNQSNLVAVVARGSYLSFYNNHQLIANVNDPTTYTHGQIGVVAYDQGSPATVIYRNVRVWTV
jgi:hypothetical protein